MGEYKFTQPFLVSDAIGLEIMSNMFQTFFLLL